MPKATAQFAGVASTATMPGAATQVVPLRFASAKELSRLLEPYVADGGKIAAETGRNALIVSGDVNVRQTPGPVDRDL